MLTLTTHLLFKAGFRQSADFHSYGGPSRWPLARMPGCDGVHLPPPRTRSQIQRPWMLPFYLWHKAAAQSSPAPCSFCCCCFVLSTDQPWVWEAKNCPHLHLSQVFVMITQCLWCTEIMAFKCQRSLLLQHYILLKLTHCIHYSLILKNVKSAVG